MDALYSQENESSQGQLKPIDMVISPPDIFLIACHTSLDSLVSQIHSQ